MADVGVSPHALARLYEEVNDRGLALGEALLRHRDGRAIPVRYQMTRIDLVDGSLYIWVAHQRTDRRSIERDPGRLADARGHRVTDRELEIVQLIADGLGNQEIAQALQISLETVKTYVRRLLGKLGARSRAHAVAIAWHNNLVD
jgi:DNA-binding CsgD family transcriptional regulator